MHATDRVVLVASGFGIWQDGRHAASGRWGDVVEVRLVERDAPEADPVIIIAMKLRDGCEVLLHERVPGFEQFLAAAERSLPGMRPRASWRAAAMPPAVPRNGTVLFERVARPG